MATIKPILNYRADCNGRHTLVLQIIHERRRGVVFTKYRLLPEEFDPKRGLAIAPNRTKLCRDYIREVNACIITQTAELRGIITQLEACGKPFRPTDITAAYRRKGDLSFIRTFTLSLIDELQGQGRHGTVRTYRATLAVFEKYRGHIRTRFGELDADLLDGFEQYLKRVPIRRNTITFYMRILRAIYNKAKRAGLTGYSGNPFETVSFRMDKTSKLALAPCVLRRVAETDLSDQKHLEEARDLFLFCFYARGMSFVDLAFLTRDTIREGVIHYKRHKTSQLFSVRITPPLQELIDKYDRCGPWVMPVMQGGSLSWAALPELAEAGKQLPATPEEERLLHKKYLLSLSRYLGYLKEVSLHLDLERRLTFNVARHSWASLARTKGIPVSVISEGLGHTSERTTIIYLDQLDARTVDNANDVVTSLLVKSVKINRGVPNVLSAMRQKLFVYLQSVSGNLL